MAKSKSTGKNIGSEARLADIALQKQQAQADLDASKKSDADWMGRNLDKRIEITCPIKDQDNKKEIVKDRITSAKKNLIENRVKQ